MSRFTPPFSLVSLYHNIQAKHINNELYETLRYPIDFAHTAVRMSKYTNQSQAAYANEMDPTQSSAQPTGAYKYTEEAPTSAVNDGEFTTTTNTSRLPHSSTTAGNTTAGPMGTSGGTLGGERVSSGDGMMGKIKGAAAAVHGTGEALRGAFNTSIDKMAGDVCSPYRLVFITQSYKQKVTSLQQAGVAKETQVQEKGLDQIRQRNFHPATTSGMTGQGTMGGSGGLTGTGAGGVVGNEARVPGGSSGDPKNAAMHDASMGRGI